MPTSDSDAVRFVATLRVSWINGRPVAIDYPNDPALTLTTVKEDNDVE